MRYVLDTNVWIDALAGQPSATNAVLMAAEAEWCGFSAITRLEIFCFPNLRPADEVAFTTMLSQFNEVPVTAKVIDEAIRLRKATGIKIPDALIAATALAENAALVTRNSSDFAKIAALRVIDPTTA